MHCYSREKIQQWSEKTLQGEHLHITQRGEAGKQNTYRWLQKGELFPETEGFLLAIQDQIIASRNNKQYMSKRTIKYKRKEENIPYYKCVPASILENPYF